MQRSTPIETITMPGAEVLLEQGEPAPYRGVLLPPGIYKGVIDEIDRRYEEIYDAPRQYRRESNRVQQLQRPMPLP